MTNREELKLLIENFKQNLHEPDVLREQDIMNTISCIHNQLLDNVLTVQYLKEECGLNGKSFSARFKKHTGRHPRDYIVHHRIELGKILLRETDLTVTDIAMETGFRSHSSFAKTFLNREGVPPSDWRSSRGAGHKIQDKFQG